MPYHEHGMRSGCQDIDSQKKFYELQTVNILTLGFFGTRLASSLFRRRRRGPVVVAAMRVAAFFATFLRSVSVQQPQFGRNFFYYEKVSSPQAGYVF